jgi:hypothetical protein
VLQQTRAKFGVRGHIEMRGIRNGALEQVVEPPVVVGKIAVDFFSHFEDPRG